VQHSGALPVHHAALACTKVLRKRILV